MKLNKIFMFVASLIIMLSMQNLSLNATTPNYSNGSKVVSSGGGKSTGGGYTNYSVVGEVVVGKQASGQYAGTQHGFMQAYGPESATIAGNAEICQGESTDLTVTIVGGTSPYDVTYSDGVNHYTVYDYQSGDAITVSPSTSKTYTILSLVDYNSLPCSALIGSAEVTVNPLPNDISLYASSGEMIETGIGYITLMNSQSGYEYEAFYGTNSVGTATGNGSNLDISIESNVLVQSIDPYEIYIVATNTSTNCQRELTETFAMTVLENVIPTQWAFKSNISKQTSGSQFTVTIEAQDANGKPGLVSVATSLVFEVQTGTGTLSGSATIPANSSSTNVNLTYNKTSGESGVVLQVDNSGGMNLDAGNSSSFDVRAAEPSSQAFISSYTNVLNRSLDVNWTNGTGSSRIIVAKQASSLTFIPSDDNSYTSQTSSTVDFTTASEVETGTKIIYNGTGSGPVSVTGLTPGKEYTFVAYEYNGSGTLTNYVTSTYTQSSVTTNPTYILAVTSIPTQVTSGTAFSVTVETRDEQGYVTNVPINTPIQVSVKTGSGTVSGSGTILLGQSSATFNVTYTYNDGESGTVLTFDNNGGTDLIAIDSETFTVLAVQPTVQSYSISFTGISQYSLTFNARRGNGSKRLVLVREGSSITASPEDGVSYTADNEFGMGSAIGGNNYVVSNGVDSALTVTGLTNGTKYSVKFFEYNGNGSFANYLTDNGSTGNPSSRFTNPKKSFGDDGDLFSHRVSSPYPNPSKDEVNFDLLLLEDANISVDLYTESGAHVARIASSQFLAAGEQKLSLSLPNDIANGTYTILLNMGSEVHIDRIVIMKK